MFHLSGTKGIKQPVKSRSEGKIIAEKESLIQKGDDGIHSVFKVLKILYFPRESVFNKQRRMPENCTALENSSPSESDKRAL